MTIKKYKKHKVTELPLNPEPNQIYYLSSVSGTTYQEFITDNNGNYRNFGFGGNSNQYVKGDGSLSNINNIVEVININLSEIPNTEPTFVENLSKYINENYLIEINDQISKINIIINEDVTEVEGFDYTLPLDLI